MAGLEKLEFLLDLDAKVDGAVKLLGVLDRSIATLHKMEGETAKAVGALQKLDRSSEHGAESAKKHGHAVWQLGHQFEEAKGKALEFAEGIGLMIALEALEKVVDKVVELGSEIVNAAAKAQTFDLSFKLALGDKAGAEMLEYLEEIAKYTTKTDDELKSLAGILTRVGFEGVRFKRALAAAGDIGSMPNGSVEEALGTIAEIKRRGEVNDRMLKPLGMGQNEFLKRMATETGMGVETIKKKIEKGTFDTDIALETFYKVLTEKTGLNLGAGWVKLSKGVEAQLKHLKDLPDQYFQGIAKTPAFEQFNNLLGAFLKRLDPDTATGKKLFASLEESFTKLVAAIARLDMNKFVADLEHAVSTLPAIVEGLLKLANALWEVGKALGWIYKQTLPGQVLQMTTTKSRVHDELAAGDEKLRAAERMRTGARSMLDEPRSGAGADFIRDSLFDTGKASGKSLAAGLKAARPAVKDEAHGLAAAAPAGAADALELHSPSRVFERLGRMSGEGYMRGLDASASGVDQATARVVTPDAISHPGASRGGGPVHITLHIETHVGGGGAAGGEATGAEIGQQVASAVEQILPGALQSAFQRMQQEAGA